MRRAEAGVRRVERRRRLRLDGGPAGARLRHRRDVRAGAVDREGGRAPEPVREDPGDDGRAARDRGLDRARHLDQHHADLLARALQGGRRGVPARARAPDRRRRRSVEGRVGRVVLRLARRHGGRQAARRLTRSCRASSRSRTRSSPTSTTSRRSQGRAGSTSRAKARRSSAASGRPRRRRIRRTAT